MAFRQGAARKHPLYGAVIEPQRRRKAIFTSTLRADAAFAGVRRCSSVTDPLGYAPSSRLARQRKTYCRKCKVISGKGH